jgi:hypothetical protein
MRDYTNILENKIFEAEYGCWVRNDAPSCGVINGCDITEKYPLKLYKHVDEKIN